MGSAFERCPGPDLVPTPLAGQAPYKLKATIDEAVDLNVNFTASAWVEEYLEGAFTMQYCILGVEEISPALSGIAGTARLWQVKYGEPQQKLGMGCGCVVRVRRGSTVATGSCGAAALR